MLQQIDIKKILFFGILLFTVTFLYTLARDIKDVLIVTSPDAGAETILALKEVGLFAPKLILFGLFLLFYRKNNLLKIFHVTFLGAITFFFIFHLYVYPHAALFHPSPSSIQAWITSSPADEGWIRAYGIWTYSLYYLLASVLELFTIAFLFWALANQTFTMQSAKLGYPLLLIFPALAMSLAGYVIGKIADDFAITMQAVGWLMMAGLIVYGLLFLYENKSDFYKVFDVNTLPPVTMAPKNKSMILLFIFLIILAYGICQSTLNIVWKSSLQEFSKTTGGFEFFMNVYSQYLAWGVLIIFLATFWVIYKFGWLRAALIPPVMTLLTTILIMVFVLFPEVGQTWANLFHLEGQFFLSSLLTMQNILLAGLGFLFLVTKEMAYIPLPLTTKARGKGVIDFLLGDYKLFGFLLGAFIVTINPTSGAELIQENQTFLLAGVALVSVLWILAVLYLGKMLKEVEKNL